MKIDYTAFYNNKNTKSDNGTQAQKIAYHTLYNSNKSELKEYEKLIQKLGYASLDS